MVGLSMMGSISLAIALVAGKNLVPRPAAGMTALRTFGMFRIHSFHFAQSTTRYENDCRTLGFLSYILLRSTYSYYKLLGEE